MRLNDPSFPSPLSRPLPRPSARRGAWARRAAWGGLLTVFLGAAGLAGCASLDERQRAWIFAPSDRTWAAGLAAAEGMDDVWITHRPADAAEPVRLHGLWLAQDRADAPVVLLLHGARWDVRGSAPRMRRLQALGFSVLAIDYRGFGRSSPALPSETMALEDARAAWAWLRERHPQARRLLYGHSLGGAVAVQLAAGVPDAAGLMVEGSFPSMAEVIANLRFGFLPVAPLLTQRFEAGEAIAKVKSPVLVVHGSNDRLIPPALGRALYDKAPEPKRFLLVEGGSHHDSMGRGLDAYREAVQALFGVRAGSAS